MRELRARMDSYVEQVLKKVKVIKKKLEALDRSSVDHRKLPSCGPGSSMTELGFPWLDDFQGLRGKMAAEYTETVERRYFTITGKKATGETIENLFATRESESFLQKAIQEQEGSDSGHHIRDSIAILERHDAEEEIEKNLLELHQVFLDMAALVEVQGHQPNNIKSHVAHASQFVKQGTEQLQEARVYEKSLRKWTCIGVVLGIVLLIWESFSSSTSFSLSWHQCCSQSRKNKMNELLPLEAQITGIPI